MADEGQAYSEAERVLQAQQCMLRGYARHLVASVEDAEDLAQEVCVEVLKNPLILLRGDDCGAYLRGIARHLASRHHRRVQRHAVLEELIELAWHVHEPENGQSADAASAVSEPGSEHSALQECLAKMPERTRGMIQMRYEDGMNSTEIAAKMSTSNEAIRVALARARQALARCVKQRLAIAGES